MIRLIASFIRFFIGDAQADRAVPPTGYTAQLTIFASGAMAFLAVFALALSIAASRLADHWAEGLGRSMTIRISAPSDQLSIQTDAVLKLLTTTPGVKNARALSHDEQRKLLEPWFGADLPLDHLPIPRLVEFTQTDEGLDIDGLKLRLAGEAPGAALDDHARWRQPLVKSATRLRALGVTSIALIGALSAVVISLAALAALAANSRVIHVLRLVGAADGYIASAFMRRYTIRALTGAIIGTILGAIAIAIMPSDHSTTNFLTKLGFQGSEWLWIATIPPFAAIIAFLATRHAALTNLKETR